MPRAIPRTKLDGGALRETRVCLCYLGDVRGKGKINGKDSQVQKAKEIVMEI